MTDIKSLVEQIAQLPDMSIKELWALWDTLFDKRPNHSHRNFIVRRIAYRLQENALGGVSGSLRKKLEKIGETGVIPNLSKSSQSKLVPGTRLSREYKGITHDVTILMDGRFEWQGQPYKSLSAIARAITGTPWNGLVFFGLKESPRKGAKK